MLNAFSTSYNICKLCYIGMCTVCSSSLIGLLLPFQDTLPLTTVTFLWSLQKRVWDHPWAHGVSIVQVCMLVHRTTPSGWGIVKKRHLDCWLLLLSNRLWYYSFKFQICWKPGTYCKCENPLRACTLWLWLCHETDVCFPKKTAATLSYHSLVCMASFPL